MAVVLLLRRRVGMDTLIDSVEDCEEMDLSNGSKTGRESMVGTLLTSSETGGGFEASKGNEGEQELCEDSLGLEDEDESAYSLRCCADLAA